MHGDPTSPATARGTSPSRGASRREHPIRLRGGIKGIMLIRFRHSATSLSLRDEIIHPPSMKDFLAQQPLAQIAVAVPFVNAPGIVWDRTSPTV